MVVNEQQAGPFSFEEIVLNPNLSPETLVWKPGYDTWIAAKTLPEFEAHFSKINQPSQDFNKPPQFQSSFREDPQSPYGEEIENNRFANNPQYQSNHSYNNQNRYQQQPPYRHYNNPYREPGHNGYPVFHTNWLPWAIVATVLGLFTSCIGIIFGIIGIVQANKANNYYSQGFEREGDSANSNAKIMTIIGLGFAGISIVASLFFGSIYSMILDGYGFL